MVVTVSLPKGNFVSFEEYEEMKKNSDQPMEYIDGVVYMSPSPSPGHQRISMKLSLILGNLLADKDCEVYAAPMDIDLVSDNTEERKTVIPDLSVICDKKGFTDQKYVGVPELIIEIISPSNQSHDLVTKLNLYMKYGVKEYWIVNPLLKNIMVYSLSEDQQYELVANAFHDVVKSEVIQGFEVVVESLF